MIRMGQLSLPHGQGKEWQTLWKEGREQPALNRTRTQSGTRFLVAGAGTRGAAAKPFPAQLCEGAACRCSLPGPPWRLQALEQAVQRVLTHGGAQGRHERGLCPEPPPPPSAGKGSVPHLGQGSACYSVPALTQMVQQLCQPPPKTPRTFCTQTAFERPWQ